MFTIYLILGFFILLSLGWMAHDRMGDRNYFRGRPILAHYYIDPAFLSPVVRRGITKIRRRKIDGTIYADGDDIWDDEIYEDYPYDDEGILLELSDSSEDDHWSSEEAIVAIEMTMDPESSMVIDTMQTQLTGSPAGSHISPDDQEEFSTENVIGNID